MGTEEKGICTRGTESKGIYTDRFNWEPGSFYRTRDNRFVLITTVNSLDLEGKVVKNPEDISWAEVKNRL